VLIGGCLAGIWLTWVRNMSKFSKLPAFFSNSSSISEGLSGWVFSLVSEERCLRLRMGFFSWISSICSISFFGVVTGVDS
jgi:hypothetical protein